MVKLHMQCWLYDGVITLEGEETPNSFDKFDDLIESIDSNISFLVYKKLSKSCMSIGTYSETDYYGGYTSCAFYQCNVEILYRELVSKGLINK